MGLCSKVVAVTEAIRNLDALFVNRNWTIKVECMATGLNITMIRRESYKSEEELTKMVTMTLTGILQEGKSVLNNLTVTGSKKLTEQEIGTATRAFANLFDGDAAREQQENTEELLECWEHKKVDMLCELFIAGGDSVNEYAITAGGAQIIKIGKAITPSFQKLGVEQKNNTLTLYAQIDKRTTIVDLSRIEIVQCLYEESSRWEVVYDDRLEKARYIGIRDQIRLEASQYE